MKRLSDQATGASEQLAKNYEDLMQRFSQMSQNQIAADSKRRSVINDYEDKLKDSNKELLSLRRENQTLQTKNAAERKRLIDDYEKRLTSTSSNQEK